MKQRGWTVWPTARKDADLQALQDAGFQPIPLDVSDSDSIQTAVETLRTHTGGNLRGLVSNAGFGQPGALEDLNRDQMRRQFEVNVFGLLELTHALLPDLMQADGGRVVHISSVVGRVALPFMGIYSASKFALEALADVQRVELDGTGVRVSLVEPGPITTAFSKNAVAQGGDGLENSTSRFAALYAKELERRLSGGGAKPFALPPEAVARKIAHALTASRPRRRYRVTLPAQMGAFMSRVAPDSLIDFILTRELRSRIQRPS
jgi:short-subunit dehydrogenase